MTNSGILYCCDHEEVTVGDCGRFHRVHCVHCDCTEDFYKKGQEPANVDEWVQALALNKECAACTGHTLDIPMPYCHACPKYGIGRLS